MFHSGKIFTAGIRQTSNLRAFKQFRMNGVKAFRITFVL